MWTTVRCARTLYRQALAQVTVDFQQKALKTFNFIVGHYFQSVIQNVMI